jgi:hypothetical protein
MGEAEGAGTEAVVRNVSDTARWAAVFRARETARADALFRDPYAERLAGKMGVDIANTLPEGNSHAWAWVARTYLFDQFIAREIEQGTDMVVNLAAGLDARPYRMALPASLQWIEVDLPEILTYKEGILASEKPACALERVRTDLSDGSARRRSRCSRRGPRSEFAFSALDHGPRLAGTSAHDAAHHRKTTQRSWRGFQVRPGGGAGFLHTARLGAGGCERVAENRDTIQAAAVLPAIAGPFAGAKRAGRQPAVVRSLPVQEALTARARYFAT